MAEGLNRVMLLGNLGADPELRFTQGGQAVLNMRLATAESYLDKDKVRQERTEWHNVVLWGKRAEALGKILGKGSSIFVEGALRTSSFEKDGAKRYKTEVVAQNIILAGKGASTGGQHEAHRYGTSGHGASAKHAEQGSGDGAPPAADGFDYADPDIPF